MCVTQVHSSSFTRKLLQVLSATWFCASSGYVHTPNSKYPQ